MMNIWYLIIPPQYDIPLRYFVSRVLVLFVYVLRNYKYVMTRKKLLSSTSSMIS